MRGGGSTVRSARLDANPLEARTAWILGSPRSGSSWLLRMLSHHQRVVPIDEPLFGVHLAPLTVNEAHSVHATRADYCLSAEYEDAWRPPLRTLVLNRIAAQVDRAARDQEIADPVPVLKEPNSSHAADLIMSLVPRSRLIFLLRDGRDVVDSMLDAMTRDTWWTTVAGRPDDAGGSGERWRLNTIRDLARVWLHQTEVVAQAFGEHDPERRSLVRYEELLAHPVETLGKLLGSLGLGMGSEDLRGVVARQSFSAIPPEDRGRGKVFRTATPGLWREHMTPAEQQLVNELLGEKLEELGYAT